MNLPLVQIAAAFLVAISACASLIVSANAKHERLSRLFRATCAEWRGADPKRKANLNMQAEYFRKRYYIIQGVQKELFGALRSFVGAFYFFVALALTVSSESYLPDGTQFSNWITWVSIGLGLMIAGFFVYGLTLMLNASGQQLKELKDSHQTLECEAEDVLAPTSTTEIRKDASNPTRVPEFVGRIP